ncbi:hypothetical protein ACQCVB_11050 [Fictibacillus phosphorivorans]|uniref:hypothetical protein n=1 Tax=Fictibacillus phosphorivorans TaxID=1221500 RepID=UPI003CF6C295
MSNKQLIFFEIKRVVKELNTIKRYEKSLNWSEEQVVLNLIAGAQQIVEFSNHLKELDN